MYLPTPIERLEKFLLKISQNQNPNFMMFYRIKKKRFYF